MKKLIIGLATLALIVGFGVMQAEAAPTGPITVTVTLRNVSVSITAGHPWELDVMAPDTTSAEQSCKATNDGNVIENFTIEVSNSSPTVWTPGATSAEDQFVMTLVGIGTLSGTPTSLDTNVAIDGTSSFGLTFKTPTSTTAVVDTEETITVTVTASPAA